MNADSPSRRRPLRFASLEELRADAVRLVEGGATTVGGWSLGQIIEHLARTIDMSLDGVSFRAPWPIRVLCRVVRWFSPNFFFDRPMPAGFRAPPGLARALIVEAADPREALAHLDRSLGRYRATSRRVPSPLLGELTDEQWTKIHLRHGELHLSFAIPNA